MSNLCYVSLPWVYFTTQALSDQWGDDWNDAPYEHNAGTPYSPCWHRQKKVCQCDICKRDYNEDGTPKWEICKLAISDHNFETPEEGQCNSSYSVEDINGGAVPWLRNGSFKIYAGMGYLDFLDIMKLEQVTVYERRTDA